MIIHSKLKDAIITYLKENKSFNPTDDILIENLIFNLEILEQTIEDIRTNGFQLNVTRNKKKTTFYQKSRSVDVYNLTLKNVLNIITTLGLSRKDMDKLKVMSPETKQMSEYLNNILR